MKSVSVIVLALFATAAVLAQSGMRPGQWELSTEMQMPNMPAGFQIPATKVMQCITAAEAKDPASIARPSGRGRGGPSPDCKMTDLKTKGNTTTYTMTCSDKMTGTGEMTFGDDSFTQTMKMVMPQGEMTTKITGKRIGDCTK